MEVWNFLGVENICFCPDSYKLNFCVFGLRKCFTCAFQSSALQIPCSILWSGDHRNYLSYFAKLYIFRCNVRVDLYIDKVCLLSSEYRTDSFICCWAKSSISYSFLTCFSTGKQKEAELCREISNSLNEAGIQPMAFAFTIRYEYIQEYVG